MASAGLGAMAPPAKRVRLDHERALQIPSGTNLIETDGKSCTHEVAWPPGMEGSPMPPPPHQGPPAREYPFKLDPFQQTALNALEAGHNVLVAAHTSAGKTVVAEYAFGMALRDGAKVVYTSPLKALSNQKYRELQEQFGDVGLMTGGYCRRGILRGWVRHGCLASGRCSAEMAGDVVPRNRVLHGWALRCDLVLSDVWRGRFWIVCPSPDLDHAPPTAQILTHFLPLAGDARSFNSFLPSCVVSFVFSTLFS